MLIQLMLISAMPCGSAIGGTPGELGRGSVLTVSALVDLRAQGAHSATAAH